MGELRANKSAAALIDILIDPAGKVIHCSTTERFGDKYLAGKICKIVLRKRIKPARLASGNAAYFADTMLMKFFIPGTRQGYRIARMVQSADAQLTVNALPGGAPNAEVTLAIAVDEAGKVTECAAGKKKESRALVDAVCGSLSLLKPPIRFDTSKMPLAHVTEFKVKLLVETPPKSEPEQPAE